MGLHHGCAAAAPPPPLGLGDVLRGAFLWAGCEEVTGAMCMVSWDKSWLSKKDGGLGV
jgi:hypothetical protein